MWSGDATLRGGQHLPQVPHHHQVLPENVEQRQRDTDLHLSGCRHGGRTSQLELDLRHRHRHSVSGGSGHRSALTAVILTTSSIKCNGAMLE